MTTSSGDDSPFEVRGGLHLHDVNGEIFLEFLEKTDTSIGDKT